MIIDLRDYEPWLTAPEIGAMFGVRVEAVREWIAAGKFGQPGRTPGNHYRISRDAVRDVLVTSGYTVIAEDGTTVRPEAGQ